MTTHVLTPEQFAQLSEEDQATLSPVPNINDPDVIDCYVPAAIFEWHDERTAGLKKALGSERERGKALEKTEKNEDDLKEQIRGYQKTEAVHDAIERSNGIPTLLKPKLMMNSGYDEDGTLVVFEGGKPMKTADGDLLSISGYAELLKGDKLHAPLFFGTRKGGGGSAPNVVKLPPRTPPRRRSLMSREDKVDFLREKQAEGLNPDAATSALLALPD